MSFDNWTGPHARNADVHHVVGQVLHNVAGNGAANMWISVLSHAKLQVSCLSWREARSKLTDSETVAIMEIARVDEQEVTVTSVCHAGKMRGKGIKVAPVAGEAVLGVVMAQMASEPACRSASKSDLIYYSGRTSKCTMSVGGVEDVEIRPRKRR